MHGVRFSENYLLYQNGAKSVLILNKDIRKVYIKKTTQKAYGIATVGIKYSVCINLISNKTYDIIVNNQNSAKEICIEILKLKPSIIIGCSNSASV